MRELRGIFLEEGLNLQTAVAFRFLQTASRASLRGFLPQIAVSAEERQHEAEGARKVPQYLVSRWKLFFFFFFTTCESIPLPSFLLSFYSFSSTNGHSVAPLRCLQPRFNSRYRGGQVKER